MPGARQAVARLAFGSLGVCESRTEHEGWRESVVVIQKLKHCSNGLYLVPGRAGWLAIVDLGIFGRSSGRHSVALESRGVQDAEGVGAGAGSLSDDVEVAQPPPGVFGDGVAAATAGPGVCALSPLHCAGHPPAPAALGHLPSASTTSLPARSPHNRHHQIHPPAATLAEARSRLSSSSASTSSPLSLLLSRSPSRLTLSTVETRGRCCSSARPFHARPLTPHHHPLTPAPIIIRPRPLPPCHHAPRHLLPAPLHLHLSRSPRHTNALLPNFDFDLLRPSMTAAVLAL